MNNLQSFSYESNEVRTIMIDGEPWFVLKDVCQVLGIVNHKNIAARLDEDEKGVYLMDTPGGPQEMTIINEPGLYAVTLRSDKPEAKAFKRWVTREVLPAVRETGAYFTPVPTVPVAAPVVPELPADARLARAELLIRAAEHPALAQEEQTEIKTGFFAALSARTKLVLLAVTAAIVLALIVICINTAILNSINADVTNLRGKLSEQQDTYASLSEEIESLEDPNSEVVSKWAQDHGMTREP